MRPVSLKVGTSDFALAASHRLTAMSLLAGTLNSAAKAARERFAQIADYYDARRQDLAQASEKGAGLSYKPLPPDRLYLDKEEWRERLDSGKLARLVAFAAPEGAGAAIDAATRQGRNFAPERAQPDANVFDAVKEHVNALQSAGKRVVLPGR
jgi:transcription-repair coupling factor (superfamily II helicase)